jgi:hypothetical protein
MQVASETAIRWLHQIPSNPAGRKSLETVAMYCLGRIAPENRPSLHHQVGGSFKLAYERFKLAIKSEKESNWKTSSWRAVKDHVKELKDLVDHLAI